MEGVEIPVKPIGGAVNIEAVVPASSEILGEEKVEAEPAAELNVESDPTIEEIGRRESLISTTEEQLRSVRERLGLDLNSGEAPALEDAKRRLDQIKNPNNFIEAPEQPEAVAEETAAEETKKEDIPEDTDRAKREKYRDERREEQRNNERMEQIKSAIGRLSQNLAELSMTISRNRFPRVTFSAEKWSALKSGETINERDYISALDDLTAGISRIQLPDGERERLSLEPHNIRSIMGVMENVRSDLSRMKAAFESASGRGVDHSRIIRGAVSAISKLGTKYTNMNEAVSILQRLKRR